LSNFNIFFHLFVNDVFAYFFDDVLVFIRFHRTFGYTVTSDVVCFT
jgi:hypothetical protein